jgi:HEAT repeats
MTLPTATIMAAVTYSVFILFGIILLLFVALVVLRIIVAKREEELESTEEEIRPLVYEILADEDTQEEAYRKIRSYVPVENRVALERVLLECARVVDGPEMELLSYLFDQFGFVDEDIENVRLARDSKKAESAYHLGVMRAVRAVPFLISALSSDNRDVVFVSLNSLSRIGTPEAVRALVEHISRNGEIETMRIAEIIPSHAEAFRPIVRDWLKTGSVDVRRQTFLIDLAGAMMDPLSVPLLASYMASPDSLVRAHATRALGGTGDMSASGPLIQAMSDPSPAVRVAASDALGRLRCEEAIGPLREGLSDTAAEVQMSCAFALNKMGNDGQKALDEGIAAAERQREPARNQGQADLRLVPGPGDAV